MPAMPNPEQPPPPPLSAQPVQIPPAGVAIPHKKSRWPWVLGCGCLTLLVLVILVAGLVFYRYRAQKEKDVSSPTRTQQLAPDDKRKDLKSYDSSKATIAPELEPHFVGFRFSYPPAFVSIPPEKIYVALRKYAANGQDIAKSVAISWFETTDPASNKEETNDFKELFKGWQQEYSDYDGREVSSGTLKIGGALGATKTWEFTTKDPKPSFVVAVRSILVHPPGQSRGVRIDEVGTWVDPKIKSASDLVKDDEIAAVLSTFQFVETSRRNPPATSAQEQSEPAISANALWQAYQNEAAADKLYKGKTLTVTGQIYFAGVPAFQKTVMVSLKDNEGKDRVVCIFPPSAKDAVTDLKEDQQVTIHGQCDGSIFHTTIQLKDCELVKK